MNFYTFLGDFICGANPKAATPNRAGAIIDLNGAS